MKKTRISLAFKALHELGPRKLGLSALYKVGLKSGYFRWKTPVSRPFSKTQDESPSAGSSYHSAVNFQLLDLPNSETISGVIGPDGLSQLRAEADEIVAGYTRLFGGSSVPLNLAPPGIRSHWTDSEQGSRADIKFVWEPARFGWVFTLGRAYHLTKDECYPEAFWRYFGIFQESNPVNQGPNWESAQEVALRLIAFVFAAQIFADSTYSVESQKSKIADSITSHAARIPPTLVYARAQNNNHLLSEAAGLITASLALPKHPLADRWSKLGWKWFKHGLRTQIADDGAYMQQSTNYHRLMLQLALWVFQIWKPEYGLPDRESTRGQLGKRVNLQTLIPDLQLATRWLLALIDPESGRVPNLGPNDGAYIFPFTVQPFHDFRPVLQAASQTFLGKPAFQTGPWDEMGIWLSGDRVSVIRDQWTMTRNQSSGELDSGSPIKDHCAPNLTSSTLHTHRSWGYLRVAHFRDRPGHADQLHLDLWWRGFNVAMDAGTYLYNADSPWDNALTHSAVHNTVMVDDRQQMTLAGRFLYLDWAQAKVLKRNQAEDGSWERIVATHDGYQRFGVVHQRSVTAYQNDRWIIHDDMLPFHRATPTAPCSVRLNWLLPDWQWKMDDSRWRVEVLSPYGWIELAVSSLFKAAQDRRRSFHNDPSPQTSIQLVRAGGLLYGHGDISPTWGWTSPTYGVKLPALSFVVTAVGELPLTLTSEWNFPHE